MYNLYHKTIARATVTPPEAGCPPQITTVPACTSTTVPQCQYHVPVQYQYNTCSSSTVSVLCTSAIPVRYMQQYHSVSTMDQYNYQYAAVPQYQLVLFGSQQYQHVSCSPVITVLSITDKQKYRNICWYKYAKLSTPKHQYIQLISEVFWQQ